MNRHDDPALHRAIVAAAREGRRCALATIVATRGSTPRKAGAKMLVDPGRGLVGTVGGGCGEAEVIRAAEEVVRTGVPALLRVDLTEDLLGWSPAVCGGVMDVFVELVGPQDPGAPGDGEPAADAGGAQDPAGGPEAR